MRRKTPHYLRERSKGRVYSAVLHAAFLLTAIIGLPDFLTPKPPEEPIAISVELLPITNVSNVKPADKPPEPEEKPEEKPAEQKKPSPPVKTAEAPPPPPAPDAVPLPDPEKKKEPEKEKKPEEKPKAEKPPEKKKEKPKEDPLAAILKSVKTTAQKEQTDTKKKDSKPTETPSDKKAVSSNYNPNLPMTMSEKDAIMSQISKCWSVPAGVKDAQTLVVVVNAEYNQDGSVIRAEVARESMGRYNSDLFFRAAADAAVRAVQRCTPLTGLPTDKYDTWRQMELRFDPKYMLN
jgi:hypothetical protein